MKKENAHNQKGFTLIETILSLFLFSMVVTALLMSLGGNLSSVTASRNRLQANYLSQEGVELVRSFRDTSRLAFTTPDDAWNDFQSKVATCVSGACDVDPISLTIVPCSINSGCQLYRDTVSGYYGTNGIGTLQPTNFSRAIILTLDPSNTYIVKIKSIVWWTDSSSLFKQQVSYESTLYKW